MQCPTAHSYLLTGIDVQICFCQKEHFVPDIPAMPEEN
jgi:hypothetical protein